MKPISEVISVKIPTTLPGHVSTEMVASVHSLESPEVDGGEIRFLSSPTEGRSFLINRKVFFQRPGSVPREEANLQVVVEIGGASYTVYLATDQYNRTY